MADTVGARLVAELCRQSGLSRDQLADRAKLAHATVAAIEAGARDPRVTTLERLARAAGFELAVRDRRPIDVFRNAAVLSEVLDLAESLPVRQRGALRYPVPRRERRA